MRMNSKFVFIDTDVYYNCINGSRDLETLVKLKESLDKNELRLLVPEVIKVELFEHIENDKFSTANYIQDYLSVEKILNRKTAATSEKSSEAVKIVIPNNSELDAYLSKSSENIVKQVNDQYAAIKTFLENLFTKHNNSVFIKLDNEILMNGVKRSVLKKAPHTRKKLKENEHTRDIDCIAFESILNFFEKNKRIPDSEIIFVVRDRDYLNEKGSLREDIINSFDFKQQIQLYKDIDELFGLQQQNSAGNEVGSVSEAVPSLAPPEDEEHNEPLIEYSEK